MYSLNTIKDFLLTVAKIGLQCTFQMLNVRGTRWLQKSSGMTRTGLNRIKHFFIKSF